MKTEVININGNQGTVSRFTLDDCIMEKKRYEAALAELASMDENAKASEMDMTTEGKARRIQAETEIKLLCAEFNKAYCASLVGVFGRGRFTNVSSALAWARQAIKNGEAATLIEEETRKELNRLNDNIAKLSRAEIEALEERIKEAKENGVISDTMANALLERAASYKKHAE